MDEIQIVRFDEAFAADFARLNYEWIEEYFVVEQHDREILDDPVKYIIDGGGQIFFVLVNDNVVGTVALICEDNDQFELAKMAVSPHFRGKGIGDILIQACIDFARKSAKSGIFLLSNTRLAPAINLYKKRGFVETPLDAKSPYERVNIWMELAIHKRNR
ncbi:hypothetical protein BH20ACI2_BH20ACI2_28940 [soil metagenome]